jgi:hypothetical protein
MLVIGTDENHDLVYEGSGSYGRAVWPPPIITPAKIVFASEGPLQPERSNDSITRVCRFREDYYDPIARIRRGRFYFSDRASQQPTYWYLEPHPALPSEAGITDKHDLHKRLFTFHGDSVWRRFLKDRDEQPLVLLGRDERFTIWTIIDIEVMATNEELITLKARGGLGVLPVIDYNRIPETFRIAIRESLSGFADEVYRAAPVSVIDRARDAATHILLAHFGLRGKDAKDLGDLIKKLDGEKLVIVENAAKIIARLHARAKPSEKEKRGLRIVREQDAQLATQCVGTMLCELKWADWA